MQNKLILEIAEQIAKEKYDGHFTLFKFTTEWRFCFGTISYNCLDKDCKHFSTEISLYNETTGEIKDEIKYGDDAGHWWHRIKQLHSGKTKEEAILKAILNELQKTSKSHKEISFDEDMFKV